MSARRLGKRVTGDVMAIKTEVKSVAWVYTGKLYDSEFQAGCHATRIREEGFLLASRFPRYVYVFRTKKGRYGVKCLW